MTGKNQRGNQQYSCVEDPGEEVKLKEAWQLSSSYSVHFVTERRGITFFQVQMRIWTSSTERWTGDWVTNAFPGFDMSLFSSRALREKLTLCSYRLKHLKHKLCLVRFDQSWECATCLGAKSRKEREGEEEERRVTLQVKLWVIVFLDKEANRVELCVSVLVLQMLTSHEAIKEVLMRPKSDLFWVLMSCTPYAGPQKLWHRINSISS